MPILARNIGTYNGTGQGIFQDLEHGVSINPWGSLPFPSPLPFPFPSLSFPSLPPFPLKPEGVVRKLGAGGINSSEGVWETPWDRQQDDGT